MGQKEKQEKYLTKEETFSYTYFVRKETDIWTKKNGKLLKAMLKRSVTWAMTIFLKLSMRI